MKIDIAKCKNVTAKKKKIREDVTEVLLDFLKKTFEDSEGEVVQVGTNEIAAVVAVDSIEGFPNDVCVVVKAEVKSWTEPAPDSKRHTEPYDRFEAAEEYQFEVKQRKEKEKKNGDKG